MELDRAALCLPIADRAVSHTFYTALGFAAVGEPGDDGLPEPLQLEVSDGLRVMLIPTGGFGVGDRWPEPVRPRGARVHGRDRDVLRGRG